MSVLERGAENGSLETPGDKEVASPKPQEHGSAILFSRFVLFYTTEFAALATTTIKINSVFSTVLALFVRFLCFVYW